MLLVSAGRYVTTERGYKAFHPESLPPNIQFSSRLSSALEGAVLELGRLDSLCVRQQPNLLIGLARRAEALQSSRIEGTQATLGEIYKAEADDSAAGKQSRLSMDAREVFNYVDALETGLERLTDLPICVRLIRELHSILMTGVRGGEPSRTPGEFRRSQNWIGPPGCTLANATYVPPPPELVPECLANWEKYVNGNEEHPHLVKCAVMHYQFEAIHPFLDGNGRIGRLLIVLYFKQFSLLAHPVLYLSNYFEQNRPAYYRNLREVKDSGDWPGWILFFLEGVAQQARRTGATLSNLLSLHDALRDSVKPKRTAGTMMQLVDYIFEHPSFSASMVCRALSVSKPTANRAIAELSEMGRVSEITGKERNRMYRFDAFYETIRRSEGIE